MIDLKKKYAPLPTVMNYDDQKRIMKELIDIGAEKLVCDTAGLDFVLDALWIAHMSSGVFVFEKTDMRTFLDFVGLMNKIKIIMNGNEPNLVETLIDMFESPGFDMP